MTENYSKLNKEIKEMWLHELIYNTRVLNSVERKDIIKAINNFPNYTDKLLTKQDLAKIIAEIKRKHGSKETLCRWIYFRTNEGRDYYINL